MMSSAPTKSAWDTRYTSQGPFIRWSTVPYNLDSNLYQECVPSTLEKNVICLPTKHQRALGARSKVSVRSRLNWNLKMLVFVEGGKPENPEKNPRSKDENRQQTQPTYDAESGNQTRAT